MPKLSLNLLGQFQANLDGQPIPAFRTSKAQALLVYLAAEPQPHSRESLMALLWPDMPPRSARHNLSQVLYYLRGTVPELEPQPGLSSSTKFPPLLADRQTIQLNPHTAIEVDIQRFTILNRRIRKHDHPNVINCAACRQDLEEAVAVYQGDFLADFFLPDSSPFESWASSRRAEYQRLYLELLDILGRIYLALGQYDAAEEAARKQIDADDLRESAYRQLLETLARTRRRSEALAVYDDLRQRLWNELSVAPEASTVELIKQIERGKLPTIKSPVQQEQNPPTFLNEEAQVRETPPPFAAREIELNWLQASLQSTLDSHGQVLFVIGSAGQGKSTLVQEFARRAAVTEPNLIAVTCYCAAITGVSDPYLPFREALNMLTGDVEAKWAAELISQHQARLLWQAMPVTLPALVKHAPNLVNSLLNGQAVYERAAAQASENTAWLNEFALLAAKKPDASVDQKQIFAEYVALLKAVAEKMPVLLIIEDLHWIDPASSGLLFYLSREIADHKILLVGTYRPEEVTTNRPLGHMEQHPLANIVSELKRQYGDIWLDLDDGSDQAASKGRQFVDAYLDLEPNQLSELFRDVLFRRTKGHPLFTVELIRAMQDRGDLVQDQKGFWIEGSAVDWTTLPLKVEGVIERRIEAIEADLQSILTAASVEGEIFTAEVLARVQQMDERMLVQQLGRDLDKRHRLVTAHAMEWLKPGRQRISLYRFQHQLFQQYLYNRLDDVERAYLHDAVGRALQQVYQDQTERVAVQLAHHFQMAGLNLEAIKYYQQAGEVAAKFHAFNEALSHYEHALELAESEMLSSDDLARIYTRLGELFLITRGDWAPEVEESYRRAYELYQHGGDSPQLFTALRGLSMFYKMRGELTVGKPYTEEMMLLAQRLDDPNLIVESSFALGSLLYFAGEHVPAQIYLQQGINSYKPEQHPQLFNDQDPGVALLSYSTHNLWLLGYPDRALQHGNDAIALAEELDHPYSLAMALIWSCWTHIFRWETDRVLEHAQTAMRLSAEHDFPLFEAVGTVQYGLALARKGQIDAGIAQMQRGLAASALAIGSETAPATLLIHFAGVYRDYLDPDEGLIVLKKALAQIGENGLHLLEPELLRLNGELLRAKSRSNAEIESIFLRAVELSRKQQVKSLELRAVMSLSRLWQSWGKVDAARRMLAEIVNWFTEGLDTADLIEAQKLLEELSQKNFESQ